ncbi:hypothetical protein BjapCC829_32420 [Bradyrhizobium barranii]|uniref:DUF2511 domain-containing protein n=1 Tax=Bradyrhizobium barranii TaxID=2992140 RepID=A0ABY3QG53_9BRAD|nr:hypothetical protein [Bradyrhizobium japonicum]UFW84613.1 hypothetical protein BjapCC829_32420 [Bradyrhizobium japonicum]
MIVAVLLATSVAQMPPAPRLNPEICANVQRTGPGYIVMKETWVLPRLKLTAGQRILPGREDMNVAGRLLTNLIEKTCAAPAN